MPHYRSIAIAALALAANLPALAEGQGHIRFVSEKIDLVFDSSNTYSYVLDYTIRALDQAGVNQLGAQYFSYQDKRELGTVELAETVSAAGIKTPVGSDNIHTQDGVVGGMTLPEQRVTQITFPKLAIGDAIHYRYRHQQLQPTLKLGVSNVTVYQTDVIHDDVQINLSYADGVPVRYDAHLLEGGDIHRDGKLQTISWHFSNKTTNVSDYSAVDHWLQEPYLIASTFANWQAIADSYQALAEPKAAVTGEVKALADEITQNISTPRDQARALYDWVRKHIRYVASYVGNGGWVPHDTQTILNNRFGDCKDHATLLEALLEAKGINASQVLIGASSDEYTLPDLPVAHFNHAINYVPALDLYLDSTSETSPFGILPEVDAGQSVLITKQFHDVTQTPSYRPEADKVVRTVHIKVGADGSGTRVTEITGYGLAAQATHGLLDSIGIGKEHDWVKRRLTDNGLLGDGQLEILQHDGGTAESYRLTENIENYLYQPEAGTAGFNLGIEGPIAIGRILRRFSEPARKSGVKCDSFAVEDQIDLELAPQMEAVYVPKDVSIRQAPIYFDAHYTPIAHGYRLTRKWGFDSDKPVCTPAEYLAMRPVIERIRKAIGGSLVYVSHAS